MDDHDTVCRIAAVIRNIDGRYLVVRHARRGFDAGYGLYLGNVTEAGYPLVG